MTSTEFASRYPTYDRKVLTPGVLNGLFAITENYQSLYAAIVKKRDEFSTWRINTWNNPPEPFIDWSNFAGRNWRSYFDITTIRNDYVGIRASMVVHGPFLFSFSLFGRNSVDQYYRRETARIIFMLNDFMEQKTWTYTPIPGLPNGYWRNLKNILISEKNRALSDRTSFIPMAIMTIFGPSNDTGPQTAKEYHNSLPDSYDAAIQIIESIITTDYRRKHWQSLFDELTNSQRRFDIIVNAMQRSAQLSELHQWLSILDLVLGFEIPARTEKDFPSNSGYYPGFWYTLEQLSEDIGYDLSQANRAALVKELKVLLHVPQMTTSASATIASHESEMRKTALNRAKALNEAENQKIRDIQNAKTEARAITDRYFLAMEQMKLSHANLVSNMMVISQRK